jgi:hypothetical protein
MSNKKPHPVLEAVAETIGCLGMMVMIPGFFFAMMLLTQMRVEVAKEQVAEQIKERHSIFGRVARIEIGHLTDEPGDPLGIGADKFSCDFTDVTFEDGRKKRFLGQQYNKPIDRGKDVEIVYAGPGMIVEVKPWDRTKSDDAAKALNTSKETDDHENQNGDFGPPARR